MIIIADSGSTKCDWALIDEKGTRVGDFQTMGLNPYFHSPDVIEKAMAKLQEEVASANFYQRPIGETSEVLAKLEKLQGELDVLVERWAELEG